MSKITPVPLSGGTGARLWPLSREALPKQLLQLDGSESLVQQTVRRVTASQLFGDLIVIANSEHRFIIAEQLRGSGTSGACIILEPEGRNTAPAAAVAALVATQRDPESILLLMPSDHVIPDVEAFHKAVEVGLKPALAGYSVLFGVKPTNFTSNYGYVQCGEPLSSFPGVFRAPNFAEKPDLKKAETYLSSGDYLWNSGIFLLSARKFLEELGCLDPELLQTCREAVDRATSDLDFQRLDPNAFRRARSVSIDYAIMERTPNAAVVPVSFPWSDIGSWSDLQKMGMKNENGTVTIGEVLSLDTYESYIRSAGPLVATLGIRDLIVIATSDAVLVTAKDRSDDVRLIVDELKAIGHKSGTRTLRDHRPWGYFESIHKGERFQVKRITVKPGHKLSLQKHFHRAEHWVVVNGTALVTRDNEQLLVRENEAVYLPLGCVHRLENPGRISLNLIEVQSGSYLGEDDIVRIEDDYARK